MGRGDDSRTGAYGIMSTSALIIIILLVLNAGLLGCILFVCLKEGGTFFFRAEPEEIPESVMEEDELPDAGYNRDIDEINIALPLSQIGPHFIFNSLNTIYYLCEKNTEAAQAAINEFSIYLRGNIDSFGKKEPIMFSEEMEHVKHYLSLEKLRYEEELNIYYEIHTRDFKIPALSVQALCENAVRHGVSKKPGGGTVGIHAWEGKDTFSVEVRDDGVGFDVFTYNNDGKNHTGIKNVGRLVEVMCGGNLNVMSEKGVGTSALIRIPKKN